MDEQIELGLIWTIPQAMEALWRDMLYALEQLVDQGGTAEGAARVLKGVAVRHNVPGAQNPLPRPSRATRERLASEDAIREAGAEDECRGPVPARPA